MRILKISLDSFGKFKHLDLDLHQPMTLVFGENEAGKSTIMDAFFLCFYGQSSSSSDVRKNVRRRYIDRQGTEARVWVVFEREGRTLRLTREFGRTPGQDKLELRDEMTGEEVSLPSGESPGEYLFDLNADSFLRSVYINSSGSIIQQASKGGDQLLDRLINLQTTGNEEISYDQVDQLLEAEEKKLSRARGRSGKIPDLEQELAEKDLALEAARRNEEEKEELLQEVRSLEEEARQLREKHQQLLQRKEEAARKLSAQRLLTSYQKALDRQELVRESQAFADRYQMEGQVLNRDLLVQMKEDHEQLVRLKAESKRLAEEIQEQEGEKGSFLLSVEDVDRARSLSREIQEKQEAHDRCRQEQALLEEWAQSESRRLGLEQDLHALDGQLQRGQRDLEQAEKEDRAFAEERKENRKRAKNKILAGTFLSLGGLGFFIYTLSVFFRQGEMIFWPFLVGILLFVWGWILSTQARAHQLTFYPEDDAEMLDENSRVEEVKNVLIRAQADRDHDQADLEEVKQKLEEQKAELASAGLPLPDSLEDGKEALRQAVYAREELNDKLSSLQDQRDQILSRLGMKDMDQLLVLYQKEAKSRGMEEERARRRKALIQEKEKRDKEEQDKSLIFQNRWSPLLHLAEIEQGQSEFTDLFDYLSQLLDTNEDREAEQVRLKEEMDPAYCNFSLEELQEALAQEGLKITSSAEKLRKEDYGQALAELSRKESELAQQLHEKESEALAIRTGVRERYAGKKNPETLKTEIRRLKERKAALDEDYQALEKGRALLKEAFAQVQRNFSPRLNARTTEILQALAGKTYSKARVDSHFALSLEDANQELVDWSFLSTGTADQAYLALRIALSDLIDSKRSLPLMLDDVFVFYDDERAEKGFNFLQAYAEEGRQVIFFTAHRRMADWAEGRKTVALLSLDEETGE